MSPLIFAAISFLFYAEVEAGISELTFSFIVVNAFGFDFDFSSVSLLVFIISLVWVLGNFLVDFWLGELDLMWFPSAFQETSYSFLVKFLWVSQSASLEA